MDHIFPRLRHRDPAVVLRGKEDVPVRVHGPERHPAGQHGFSRGGIADRHAEPSEGGRPVMIEAQGDAVEVMREVQLLRDAVSKARNARSSRGDHQLVHAIGRIPDEGVPHGKEKDCRRQKDTDRCNPPIPLFSDCPFSDCLFSDCPFAFPLTGCSSHFSLSPIPIPFSVLLRYKEICTGVISGCSGTASGSSLLSLLLQVFSLGIHPLDSSLLIPICGNACASAGPAPSRRQSSRTAPPSAP